MTDTSSHPMDLAAPSGERRQVTALFADMVGFTAISERLGEEGTFALIQPIYELMAGAVREQGGSVKDFTGDGIMALFGAPDALEDGPLRACRAGLAIHERLAAAAPAIEARHGVRPHMRIGVNSGLAVVTQIRGESGLATALGDTVNLASRLQTLAEPGTVYLSEATQRLVQGLVETTFAGERASVRSRARPSRRRSIDSTPSCVVPRGSMRRSAGASAPLLGASANWMSLSARSPRRARSCARSTSWLIPAWASRACCMSSASASARSRSTHYRGAARPTASRHHSCPSSRSSGTHSGSELERARRRSRASWN
ncbi:MAG: adenylate/guanylate cyclase domain-containing protein, partial [Roseiarcus sp.]